MTKKKIGASKQIWRALGEDTFEMTVPGGRVLRYEVWPTETSVVSTMVFVPNQNIFAPLGRLGHDPEPAAFITNQG